MLPFEIHDFVPFSVYVRAFSSYSYLEAMDATSEPALGSVRPNAPRSSPRSRRLTYFSRDSALPNRSMGDTTREDWTDIMDRKPESIASIS